MSKVICKKRQENTEKEPKISVFNCTNNFLYKLSYIPKRFTFWVCCGIKFRVQPKIYFKWTASCELYQIVPVCPCYDLGEKRTWQNANTQNPNRKKCPPKPLNPNPLTQNSVAFHTPAFCPWHSDRIPLVIPHRFWTSKNMNWNGLPGTHAMTSLYTENITDLMVNLLKWSKIASYCCQLEKGCT